MTDSPSWPTLQWTENFPPTGDCSDPIQERLYIHCVAGTHFGRFLVGWGSRCEKFIVFEKPWRSDHQPFDSLEAAKAACQHAWNERLKQSGCVPAPAAGQDMQTEQLIERIKAALINAIGWDAYDCTRVWNAWNVGTMRQDDFLSIIDNDERITEIALAVIETICLFKNQ